ncbi:MAG: ribosomal L7Ae/L30e/S12e/Gadd45 family protein [Oscillospiraceae bacterium]
MDKIAQMICMAKRAGKLILGFDVVKQALQKDEAELILIASDVSPKTEKEIMFFLEKFDGDFLKVDITLDEFWFLIGKRVGVIAVTDQGFSDKIKTLVTSHTN